MRAVFLDLQSLEDLDLSELQSCVDELVIYPATQPDEVASRIEGFDIVLANKAILSAETIAAAKQLKLICVVATGVNNVDIKAAEAAGVAVCHAVAYGVNAVAQHTLTLMLALATNLAAYDRAVQAGKWQSSPLFCLLDYPIVELAGKTLGIVGYGALGQAVAKLAEAFGMQVLISNRPGETDVKPGRVPFESLLEQVDVLSLHCPLTEETQGLIGADELKRMHNEAFLINVARGGIVDEVALVEALKNGEIAGAAADVLRQEPPREGNPLLDTTLPNLIVTPHCAWGSQQAREEIIRQSVENIRDFVAGKSTRRVI